MTNRNSYVRFPLVPKSTTLDDLELLYVQITAEFRVVTVLRKFKLISEVAPLSTKISRRYQLHETSFSTRNSILCYSANVLSPVCPSVRQFTRVDQSTRKPCYRKGNRAMRPIYGCFENFCESLTTPTATFADILNALFSDRSCESAYKI